MIGYIVLAAIGVAAVLLAARYGRRSGQRNLQQRLTALSNRLGVVPPDEAGVEPVLSHLEQVTGEAAEAVTEASADAIRLRRALDTLPEPEREVVKLRYGINGDDPTPLGETGRRLGISQDAVRKLERRALTELAQNRELEALRPAA